MPRSASTFAEMTAEFVLPRCRRRNRASCSASRPQSSSQTSWSERVASVLLHGLPHPIAEALVGLLGARRADDREVVWQQVAVGERVERRHQLELGQIARSAEDDECAWLRLAACAAKPLEERVVLGQGGRRSFRALFLRLRLLRVDRVAAELDPAERRAFTLAANDLVLARGEAGEERRGDHRHRHVLRDRLGDRPATARPESST